MDDRIDIIRNLGRSRTRGQDVFGTDKLGCLAKHYGTARSYDLIAHDADNRIGGKSARCIGSTAIGPQQQVAKLHWLALDLRGILHKLLRNLDAALESAHRAAAILDRDDLERLIAHLSNLIGKLVGLGGLATKAHNQCAIDIRIERKVEQTAAHNLASRTYLTTALGILKRNSTRNLGRNLAHHHVGTAHGRKNQNVVTNTKTAIGPAITLHRSTPVLMLSILWICT